MKEKYRWKWFCEILWPLCTWPCFTPDLFHFPEAAGSETSEPICEMQ